MFNHVKGTLTYKAPAEAVVEAGGVGYLFRIPVSTYEALPSMGKPATLLAYLHVTDDALTLFGFATEEERAFFLQLLNHVSGVGPKTALAVVSGGRIAHLQQAIRLGNVAALKAIKGVGENTAKRIILELGKILTATPVQAEKSVVKAAKGAGKAPEPAAEESATGDQLIDLAVKAVAQLNEVPSDIALRAVQRAADELRTEGRNVESVQDLVRRALRYAN